MSIILTRDGFEEYKNNKRVPINLDVSFLGYWRDKLEIENTTLLDLVNILISNESFIPLLEMLTKSNILSFLKSVSAETKDDLGLDTIVIKKQVVIIKDKCYESFDCSTSCSGRFKDSKEDPMFDMGHEYCAIDFCDWNELKHLPIILDDVISVVYYQDKNEEKIGDFDTHITVGEFFTSLFDELCFFGSPNNRDKEKESINETMRKIDSGEIKTISWNGWKKGLEE